jgi:transcriptional regulator
MALYVPPAFGGVDPALALQLIDEHPFAMLVTPTDAEPQVTHLPLLRDGDALLGHFARANPHWHALGSRPSLAIFSGPHAYVSPTWYGAPEAAVPTWNFATVHILGRVEILDEVRERERVLDRLVARFEGDGEHAWRFAMRGRQRAALLDAIVAFRLPIGRLTAKFKLSQNRDASDRTRVADALERSEHADARATAAWMRRLDGR